MCLKVPRQLSVALVNSRLIIYNTIQHTKRLCDYKISLSSERSISIVQNAAESILKTLNFIENHLVPSFDKNKLRFEVYVSLKSKVFCQIQQELMSYAQQFRILHAPSPYVLAIIKTLCGLTKKCLEVFSEFTFTNFKILCEVYYQLVAGVFCINRLNEDLLQSKGQTTLQKKDFIFPRTRMTTDALIDTDWKKLLYKTRSLFKCDLAAVPMLLNIAEISHLKLSSRLVEKAVHECAVALGPLFLDFYKEPPKDVEMVCLSLNQFLKKQALVKGGYVKDACVYLLNEIAINAEYFDELARFIRQTIMFCRQNGTYFYYIPESNICDLQYLASLTDRYSMLECERAVELFFVGEGTEKFAPLEYLINDVTLEAHNLAADVKYAGHMFTLDLNAILRCLFFQVCLESGRYLHLYQLVNNIRDVQKFVAIATVQANLLIVR
jgi:hypothetical protein